MLGDTAASLTVRIIKFNAQSMENRQQEAEVGEAEGAKSTGNAAYKGLINIDSTDQPLEHRGKAAWSRVLNLDPDRQHQYHPSIRNSSAMEFIIKALQIDLHKYFRYLKYSPDILFSSSYPIPVFLMVGTWDEYFQVVNRRIESKGSQRCAKQARAFIVGKYSSRYYCIKRKEMNSSPPKEEDQSRVAVPVKEGGLLEPGCLLQTHQKEPVFQICFAELAILLVVKLNVSEACYLLLFQLRKSSSPAGQEICEKGWELREPSESDKDALRDSEAEPLQHNIPHSDRTSALSSQLQTPKPLPSAQLPETSQPGLSPFGRLCPLLKALGSHPATSPFPRLPRMPRL
ncbi:hypothetical protein ACRRTK_024276 [Alexandromys fortis]